LKGVEAHPKPAQGKANSIPMLLKKNSSDTIQGEEVGEP